LRFQGKPEKAGLQSAVQLQRVRRKMDFTVLAWVAGGKYAERYMRSNTDE